MISLINSYGCFIQVTKEAILVLHTPNYRRYGLPEVCLNLVAKDKQEIGKKYIVLYHMLQSFH